MARCAWESLTQSAPPLRAPRTVVCISTQVCGASRFEFGLGASRTSFCLCAQSTAAQAAAGGAASTKELPHPTCLRIPSAKLYPAASRAPPSGCEIGVASTKAYTSQIAAITMMALALR